MIFESGWFLRQMNKYAPRGFEFKTVDNNRRIALYAREIMGEQSPRGPFVSEFSFDMLDCLFSGLLTKPATVINPAERATAYIGNYSMTRREEKPETLTQAAANDQMFNIFKNVFVSKRNTLFAVRPIMFRKNVILIQGMLDSRMELPKYLSERISKYVSDVTYHAITSVFSSMSIAQMKESMEKYGDKANLLGIVPGVPSGVVRLPEFVRRKQYENTDEYIAWLQYDILPDCTATASEQVLSEIERLTKIRDSYAPHPKKKPAREMMPEFFYEPDVSRSAPKEQGASEEPIDLFECIDIDFGSLSSYDRPKLSAIPARPGNIPEPAAEMSDNPPPVDNRRLRKNTLVAQNRFGQLKTLLSVQVKKPQHQK